MAPPKGHAPYPGCETGGRPPKYSNEEIEKYADELIIWARDPMNLWVKDFCLDKDIDPDFMSQWADKNNKFAGAYRIARSKQEAKLVNGGLTEVFSGSIVKFVLANVHGWSEKTETKISGDATNPLSFIVSDITGLSRDFVEANEAQD